MRCRVSRPSVRRARHQALTTEGLLIPHAAQAHSVLP